MDRLILFRHGKTEARAPSGEDFDRQLTARGVRDARLVADALAEAGHIPDRALVSAAVRARGTWEAIAPVYPAAVVENRPDLYDSDARILLAAGETPLGKTVLIVAHNPGLHILATALAGRAHAPGQEMRLRNGLPTGAAAVFGFTGDKVEVLGLFYPKDFGGGAGLSRVYKITTAAEWAQAERDGAFAGSALDRKDGYIHLSTAAQAGETARLHFRGQAGLILLGFEAEAFGDLLKWEPSRGGQMFPHLYAALPTASAVSRHDLPLDAEGAPTLPDLGA